MMKKRIPAGLACLAMLAALTACGTQPTGSDATSAATVSTSAITATVTEPTTTAAGGDPSAGPESGGPSVTPPSEDKTTATAPAAPRTTATRKQKDRTTTTTPGTRVSGYHSKPTRDPITRASSPQKNADWELPGQPL